jgi:hypothetical protein
MSNAWHSQISNKWAVLGNITGFKLQILQLKCRTCFQVKFTFNKFTTLRTKRKTYVSISNRRRSNDELSQKESATLKQVLSHQSLGFRVTACCRGLRAGVVAAAVVAAAVVVVGLTAVVDVLMVLILHALRLAVKWLRLEVAPALHQHLWQVTARKAWGRTCIQTVCNTS